MEQNFQKELQELQNLETAGSIEETQQSRLALLKSLDEAEKTAQQKSKDLESALAQKEHFRTKFEASQVKPEIKTDQKSAQAPTIDIADLHALRNVHEDDISEVQEYAQFKGISIREALKTGVVKTLLSEKSEMRKSAEASHVGPARASSNKVSDDEILSKAKEGDLADADKMAELRQKARMAKITK